MLRAMLSTVILATSRREIPLALVGFSAALAELAGSAMFGDVSTTNTTIIFWVVRVSDAVRSVAYSGSSIMS